MKVKQLIIVVLAGFIAATSIATEIPTDPLNGKPPVPSKLSAEELNYQVKYQRAFQSVIWSMIAIDIYGINKACLEVGGGRM